MNLYHAVIVCKRDEHLIPWHVQHVDDLLASLNVRCMRWLYYNIDTRGLEPKPLGYSHSVLPFLETYENLPLKTYGMLVHALTTPCWTHLLKTDVNSYPSVIKPNVVEQHHLVGYRTTVKAGITAHAGRCHEKGLDEPYLGPCKFPDIWCGGPAYILTRTLAEKVVALGAWHARAWPYEDVMVSAVALDNGWPAADGVGYWTDGHDYRH